MRKICLLPLFFLLSTISIAQINISAAIDAAADKIEPKTIAWRRDFHEHPELGNREFRTAKIVAEILSGLRKYLHGTVKFIFQPAEEGPPNGEEGGAISMNACSVPLPGSPRSFSFLAG
jgi:metal-dependent amidase/aminoacylase/carboxypeptidase family protein